MHPENPENLRRQLRASRDEMLEIVHREAAAIPGTAEFAGETAPPRPESALVYVRALDREIWIACDDDEAVRLREELAAEGDTRPVTVATEIEKLAGQPKELIESTVRALAIMGGTVASTAPIVDRGAR